MEKITVQGARMSDGEVHVHGYKHAMVQIVSASIALNIPVSIRNAPLVDDTFVLKEIIERAGGSCEIEDHILKIDPREMFNPDIDEDLSKKIHGSLYLMPAFGVRFGKFSFGESGGCQIGSSSHQGKRPVDHMWDVMNRFGIKTIQENERYVGKKTERPEKISIDILDYSESRGRSTSPKISGATKTALLCAIDAPHAKIYHPYLKTDVQDLLRFLRECGYQISASRELIEISAPKTPREKHQWIEFYLTECVSEVMTYITLAIHTDIRLQINVKAPDLIKNGLMHEFDLLNKMGVPLKFSENGILVEKSSSLQSVDIDVTNDSIQSDHHPFFALMLMKGNGKSRIREFVWRNRFAYVPELQKIGAQLRNEDNVLYISPSRLSRGHQILKAADTRAAAILLLASLTAEPPIEIENIQHLHRGYENLIGALESLGADLRSEVLV